MAQRPQAPSAGFEFSIGKAEQSFSWTSEKVEQLMLAIEEGYKPKATPFYEGNPNLRKGNIVFNYTPHEIREIKKCATDIVYFANNYCTVMTDHGLQTITLRPYQEEMLRQFQAERFNICLAARQIRPVAGSWPQHCHCPVSTWQARRHCCRPAHCCNTPGCSWAMTPASGTWQPLPGFLA